MGQTKEGAEAVAAKKVGVSVSEYRRLRSLGLKHCYKCRTWRSALEFGKDLTRYDGLDATCGTCRRVKVKVCRKGCVSAFKGKRHTAESKAKMSAARIGKISPQKGQKRSIEVRRKIAAATFLATPKGKDHYAWRDGADERRKDARRKAEYRWWRDAVFARDNYTCQKCGDSKGGNLRAHHIKPFAKFVELRFNVSNGQTLCSACHDLEHFKPGSTRNIRKLKRGERLWS